MREKVSNADKEAGYYHPRDDVCTTLPPDLAIAKNSLTGALLFCLNAEISAV